MLDNLQDPCCEPPHVCTRASRVNLNVRVITRCPSDCSSSAEEPLPPPPSSATRRKVCWQTGDAAANDDSCCEEDQRIKVRGTRGVEESTCTPPISTTNKSCSAEVSQVDNATSVLITEGVDLLKEGARIMERSCEMVDSKTTSALQETAAKLTEAIDGQLKILREENEILRTTNSILRNQLTATQISPKPSEDKKGKGDSTHTPIVRDNATLTEERNISVLHELPTCPPTVAASVLSVGEVPPTGKPQGQEGWLELEMLRNQMGCLEEKMSSLEQTCETQAKQLACLQEKVLEVDVLRNQMSCLDGRAATLHQTCENQAKQLEALQEKLHRQEIRYHDTIGKFDETIQSMKIMFDGLRKAISPPSTTSPHIASTTEAESSAISSSSSAATKITPPKAKAKKK